MLIVHNLKKFDISILAMLTNLGENLDFLVIVLLPTYQYQLIVQFLQIFVLQLFCIPICKHYFCLHQVFNLTL